MRPLRLITLIVVLALVATACGGADEGATEESFTTDRGRLSAPLAATEATDAVAETTAVAIEPTAGPDAEDGAGQLGFASPTTTASGERAADGSSLFEPQPEDPPTGVITQDYGTNPFARAATDPYSTFALDVDTGSYTVARQWVESGRLPEPDLVRVEEFVNFFDQDYPAPLQDTFAVYADGAPTPFAQSSQNHLIRIGIKAREVAEAARPDARLTFVIDVSGSMNEGNRLEMVKGALGVLVDQLRPTDTVAVIAYDTNAWVVLDHTPAAERQTILDAIARLYPGGSTNAEAGLTLGYDLATDTFERGLINRVILASDGVANVGTTSAGGILSRIEEQASIGINLVSIGVGLGNYNDVLLEQLADRGDGFYAYVDTLEEAERLFVEGLTGTLLTVAEEAKVQVEFNPDTVEYYRLLGFENRAIADQEFRNDSLDAGEIGAGHEVTALYEVSLTRPLFELGDTELATVNLRWREPGATVFSEVPGVLPASVLSTTFADSSAHFQLDVVAAAYAEVLRNSPWGQELSLSWVAAEASRVAELIDDPDVWDFATLTAAAAGVAGEPVSVLGRP